MFLLYSLLHGVLTEKTKVLVKNVVHLFSVFTALFLKSELANFLKQHDFVSHCG